MNRSILISSEKLKKNLLKKKILNDVINDNLYKINDLIDVNYKNNKEQLVTNLPISFNIPESINHRDFQIEVYFNIIEILESKGYKVNIKINQSETIIKINWQSTDSKNIDYMKKKIKDVLF